MNKVEASVFVDLFWGASGLSAKAAEVAGQLYHDANIQTSLEHFKAARSQHAMHHHLHALINYVTHLEISPFTPSFPIGSIPASVSPPPSTTILEYVPIGNTSIGGPNGCWNPTGAFVERKVAERLKLANGYAGSQALEEDDTSSEDPTPEEEYQRHLQEQGYAFDRSFENASGTRCVERAPPASSASSALEDDSAALSTSAAEYLMWQQVAIVLELRHSKDVGGLPSSMGRSSPEETGDDHENARPGVLQIQHYLLEMRSALGIRSHAFGCLIVGNCFEIWVADACGYVRSEPVDITTQSGFRAFACIVAGLARASTATLGLDTRFIRHSDPCATSGDLWPVSLEGWAFTVDAETTVTFRKSLHVEWSLFGRNKAVYEVEWKKGDEDMEGLLEFGYSSVAQTKVADRLIYAKKIAGDGVPVHYGAGEGIPVSNSKIRRALLGRGDLDLHDRRFAFVLLELLKPIRSVPFQQAVSCYINVVEALATLDSMGMQHRDVCMSNVMVRVNKRTGVLQGVLNDFDLAVKRGDQQHDSRSRQMGNFPFRAFNLLKPIEGQYPDHILRFDLESLIYVLEWHAVYFICGKETHFPKGEEPLREWLSEEGMINFSAKAGVDFVFDVIQEHPVLQQLPAFTQCYTEISDMLYTLATAIKQTGSRGPAQQGTTEWSDMAGKFTIEIIKAHLKRIAESFTGRDTPMLE